MADALDRVQVEIEANIEALRARLDLAQKMVDDATKKMDETTKKRSLFGGLGGSALGRALGGFHLLRAGLGGLAEAARGTGTAWERFAAGAGSFADTVSFGLTKSLEDIIVGFTNLEQGADKAAESVKKLQDRLAVSRMARKAELELAVLEAGPGPGRLLAERRLAQYGLQTEQSGLPAGPGAERYVSARQAIIDRQTVNAYYGPVPSSMVPQLLRQIETKVGVVGSR